MLDCEQSNIHLGATTIGSADRASDDKKMTYYFSPTFSPFSTAHIFRVCLELPFSTAHIFRVMRIRLLELSRTASAASTCLDATSST